MAKKLDISEHEHFVDTIGCAMYALKAMRSCELAGVECNEANISLVLARWLNSENPHFLAMVVKVLGQCREIQATAKFLVSAEGSVN